MPPVEDMSIISLVLQASFVVQMVMVLLLALSFMSWWHIFSKYFTISTATKHTEEFEDRFWSGADLNSLYEHVKHSRNSIGMEKIFMSGFSEFLKLRQKTGMELSDVMEGSRRAMRGSCQRELDHLDKHNLKCEIFFFFYNNH